MCRGGVERGQTVPEKRMHAFVPRAKRCKTWVERCHCIAFKFDSILHLTYKQASKQSYRFSVCVCVLCMLFGNGNKSNGSINTVKFTVAPLAISFYLGIASHRIRTVLFSKLSLCADGLNGKSVYDFSSPFFVIRRCSFQQCKIKLKIRTWQ